MTRLSPMWKTLAGLCSFLLLFCIHCEGAKHSKEPAKDGLESLTLVLEHAIGSGDFVERGVASVRSLKSSVSSMSLSQGQLSPTQLEDVKAAAVKGEVYRVRAPIRLSEGLEERDSGEQQQQQFVSTTISACALVHSQLSDVIKVTGDGRGNVIGLALTTLPGPTTTDCTTSQVVLLPRSFNTSIILDNGSPPPAPDVQKFQQKKEKEEREKREGKDDRSFFQKYWLYIVIGVFLIMTLNGAAAGGGGSA